MNKARRNKLNNIKNRLDELFNELKVVQFEEDESRDNMPESLIDSERFEISEYASDNMDNAMESIFEAIDYIKEIIE